MRHAQKIGAYYYWQFQKNKKFPFLCPDKLTDTWNTFIEDPRTIVDMSKIIVID